jgi:hypothetical protein
MIVDARQLGIRIAKLLDDRRLSVLCNHAVNCLGVKLFGLLCSAYLDERQSECQCSRLHVREKTCRLSITSSFSSIYVKSSSSVKESHMD